MLTPRAVSVLGFVALFAAVLILLHSGELLATSPVFLAVQVVAALLMLWARITFGRRSFHAAADPTEGELVTSGPYAFVRHPIYAAILLFVAGAVGCHPSLQNFGALLLACGGALARIGAEEKLLRAHYAGHRDYAARTKRLVPFIY